MPLEEDEVSDARDRKDHGNQHSAHQSSRVLFRNSICFAVGAVPETKGYETKYGTILRKNTQKTHEKNKREYDQVSGFSDPSELSAKLMP